MPLQRRRILSDNTTDLAGRAVVQPPKSLPLTNRNRSRRRSGELLSAIAKFDAATDPETRRKLAEFVQNIYEEEDLGQPVALFSTCYLGHPYLDHVMSLDGEILTHFKRNERLSPDLEPARALARSGAYAFIELYDNGSMIPVRETGQPVT